MRFLLQLCIVFFANNLIAQIYVQDFETSIDDMILVDNDNNTPNVIVENFDEAWTVSNDEKLGNGSKVAISNSWYSPRGIADDWMITPKIEIPNNKIVLNWEAKSFNMDFRDGYQVLVSTLGTELSDFTDIVFDVDHEMVDWTERFVSLQNYAGKSIHIAFRNNSNDMVLLGIDNIIVKEIQSNSAKINSITTTKFHEINTPLFIDGTIVNIGANNISTIDIKYDIDGNTFVHKIKNIDLEYGQLLDFTIEPNINIDEYKDYKFILSTQNPNGELDELGNNILQELTITPVSDVSKRMMIAEESTSTRCGTCPKGHVWMDYMSKKYPDDFIGIAIHFGENDPMNVNPYSDPIEQLPGFKGSPQVLINRMQFFNVTEMELMHVAVANDITPIGFEDGGEVIIDESKHTVQVSFSAISYANLADIDYRFNVVFIENDVKRNTSDYEQYNAYSGKEPTLEGAGLNWSNEPDPVPASKMKYDLVARSILGGWDGYQYSIPRNLSKDEVVHQKYIGYISSEWNRSKMYAVIMIIDNATGEILNAKKMSIAKAVGTNDLAYDSKISVFPNPTSSQINLKTSFKIPTNFDIQLINMNGQLIHQSSFQNITSESIQLSTSDLVSGMYFLHVISDKGGDVLKVVVK